jgi:hypothetical protein
MFVLGFAAKSTSDYFDHRRVREREREAKEIERRYKLAERGASFQRETLLQLQETMFELIRTSGMMHHQDLMEHRAGGEWHKRLYGEDLGERNRAANARTAVLAVRVRDESVRKLVQAVKDSGTVVMLSRGPAEGDEAMTRMSFDFEILNHRIGELLRAIDEELP